MQQQRFIIFLVLAVAILFGWNYFFPTKAPQPANTNNANTAQSQSSPAQQPTQTPVQQAPQTTTPAQGQQQNPAAAPAAQNVERREFTVETPLYKVKLDNQGAVATSWIITKDKTNGREL